jgi:hypothetical protein
MSLSVELADLASICRYQIAPALVTPGSYPPSWCGLTSVKCMLGRVSECDWNVTGNVTVTGM